MHACMRNAPPYTVPRDAQGVDRTALAATQAPASGVAIQLCINCLSSAAERSDFSVGAILVYAGELSEAEVTRVEDYLSSAYGIPLQRAISSPPVPPPVQAPSPPPPPLTAKGERRCLRTLGAGSWKRELDCMPTHAQVCSVRADGCCRV